ncbi:hypothetical protein ACET3Z_001055 [Daucus carota]
MTLIATLRSMEETSDRAVTTSLRRRDVSLPPSEGRALTAIYFYFQLADEGASPPFHPFREFLSRIGISVSPPEIFPPSPPRSPQRVPKELLDKINSQIAEGTFISDMDSSSPQPEGTQDAQQPTGWARPADYDSEIESWFEDVPTHSKTDKTTKAAPSMTTAADKTTEVAPSKPDKGKSIAVEDSPYSPSNSPAHEESSAGSEDAPEEGFSEFVITSPDSSPEPYEHPKIESWEEDVDCDALSDNETLSPRAVEAIKRRAGKMSCVDQDFFISWDELEWLQAYYHMEGKSVVPKDGMRPHRFDKENIRIPRMVTTLRHEPLGVTAPLPQYYVNLCDWFKVAPIQLSPNSYMLAAGLYILFDKVGLGAPSMRELSHFFRLAQSQPGYFYLVVQHEHNKKGLSEGRNTHVKKWKDTFFYTYNTMRVTTQFNPNPVYHDKISLSTKEAARVAKVFELPASERNIPSIVTEENLIKVKLLPKEVGTKVGWKKFIDGRPVGEKLKGTKRKRSESSDSEGDNEEDMPRPSFISKKGAVAHPSDKAAASGSKQPQEKAAPSTLVRAIPDAPDAPSIEQQPAKRKRQLTKGAPSMSKSARHFADMGDTYVDDKELDQWRAKPQGKKDTFLLKGAAEFLVHLHDREERRLEDAASLKKAEESLSKLREDFKSQREDLKRAQEGWKSCQKLLKEEKARLEPLQKEVEGLKKSNKDLATANQQLKDNQASLTVAETAKIEGAVFDDGVNNYVATFIAGAPSFDWGSHFGSGMAKWVEEFKVEQPELITAKKTLIEETLAKDASSSREADEQARPQDNTSKDATDNQAP